MSFKVTLDFGKLLGLAKNILGKISISHLLLVLIALHLLLMPFPESGFIFDEVHYIKSARATLAGEAANIEHTPLAKIVYAVSLSIFGDYWFAWRIPAVLASLVSVFMLYLIASKFMSRDKALLVSAFLGFDTLFFVNSSIAILDGPAIALSLFGAERFLRGKWKTSAVLFGLAFLMKELALLIAVGVVLYHIALNFKGRVFTNKQVLKVASVFVALFCVVSLGGLWAYDLAYKPLMDSSVMEVVQANVLVDTNSTPITTSYSTATLTNGTVISNPISHLWFAFNYFKGLTPTIQTNASDYRPPWAWVLPLDNWLNPPKYLVVAVSVGSESSVITNWVSMVSPAIGFMFIPLVVVCCYLLFKSQWDKRLPLLVLCWSLASFLPWLLLGMFVQRMTFNYYFVYTVPALCLGMPLLWDTLPLNSKSRQVFIAAQLLTVLMTFMFYFPITLFR